MERGLTESERHVLFHTLGLDWKDTPYRNGFMSSDGHADQPHIDRLVELGLMEKGDRPHLYHATPEGERVAERIKASEALAKTYREAGKKGGG